MNPFSIRIVDMPGAEQRLKKVLSIHLLRPEISTNSFDSTLSQVILRGNQFDEIHFVGFENCINQARLWLNDESSIRGRLELVVVDFLKSTRIISFNEQVGKYTVQSVDGIYLSDAQKIVEIDRKYSLHELFITNNGRMVAPNGFHYVKPSYKHVNIFLRTANVLEESSAANIIAFWFMEHIWKKNIEHIVVDTSGIADIALTVAYEAISRSGLTSLPIISSHQSYGGLDKLKITRPSETVFLISATTSGSLKDDLLRRGANNALIFTLFYLGEISVTDNSILCDLTKQSTNEHLGLDIVENFNENDCPYCKQKSYSVSLGGDQFTFEPPKVDEVHIALSDLPEQQKTLINQLAGIDFFKVYRNINDRSLEIFLDAKSLFSKPPTSYAPTLDLLEHLVKRWKGMVLRGASINIKRIIYANYPFSKELADSAVGISLEYQNSFEELLLSSRELRSLSFAAPGAAALVVVSCIDDSHELMAINRDLRTKQPQGNTTYISPIFRADTSRERARIKSNLTFGENGPNTFNLYSMLEIDLPEENIDHSWNVELKKLHEIVDWADLENIEIPEEISKRIEFLEKQAPTEGISENLFWPDFKGKQLIVRSDFTLLSTEGGTRHISQADIFVVVAAVMHNLRQGVPGKSKLSYKPYERAVLSPDNFERFNDGVIQSAILRTARGYELTYANCDANVSDRMKNFIISHVEKVEHGEGEALMEFLLAIACGRLTLHQKHLVEVAKAIQEQNALGSHYQMLAKYMIIKN